MVRADLVRVVQLLCSFRAKITWPSVYDPFLGPVKGRCWSKNCFAHFSIHSFHFTFTSQQRHLRAILRVPYTDRITNDQILDRAGVPDIEMIVRKMQLRWAGHVARMSDNRIPKQLLFGELTIGTRNVGRPLLRWKDSLKDTLKQSNISTTHWQDTATDRSAWRRSIHDGLVLYDDSRRERNATKRARRHAARNATSSASQDAYMCRHCGRTCSSRIGILSHERACNKQKRT